MAGILLCRVWGSERPRDASDTGAHSRYLGSLTVAARDRRAETAPRLAAAATPHRSAEQRTEGAVPAAAHGVVAAVVGVGAVRRRVFCFPVRVRHEVLVDVDDRHVLAGGGALGDDAGDALVVRRD